MRVWITYSKCYDPIKGSVLIGGIQTYIDNLVHLIIDRGWEAHVVQASPDSFVHRLEDGLYLHGVHCPKNKLNVALTRYAEREGDVDRDILIFATHSAVIRNSFSRGIAINHGIFWDGTSVHGMEPPAPFDTFARCLQALEELKRSKLTWKTVCVDHNYVCWRRTQTVNREWNYSVIPNFADTTPVPRNPHHDGILRIVYARRFELIRGTSLMANVVPRIVAKYDNVHFTLAGSGSEEDSLRRALDGVRHVEFTIYDSRESRQFHSQFDIALVPTFASEGTSLSLLEAMSVACAPICTDVGGMTNIVLDGYNGLMVRPTADDLYEAICRLVEDDSLRQRIAERAQETIRSSFSLEKWQSAWNKVFNEAEAM